MCLFLITLNFKSYQGVIGLKYLKKEIEIYFVLKLKKQEYESFTFKFVRIFKNKFQS